MNEFERAKRKYEKRAKPVEEMPEKHEENVVPIQKKKPDSFAAIIIDDGNEYIFEFILGNVKGSRMGSQRNKGAYQKILEDMLSKEFGRWQLVQTP